MSPHTAHDLPRRFGSELRLIDVFQEGVFPLPMAVSNTPIEKRFYATLLENMERVASSQGVAKTQLDHPLECSLDYSRRGPHTSS